MLKQHSALPPASRTPATCIQGLYHLHPGSLSPASRVPATCIQSPCHLHPGPLSPASRVPAIVDSEFSNALFFPTCLALPKPPAPREESEPVAQHTQGMDAQGSAPKYFLISHTAVPSRLLEGIVSFGKSKALTWTKTKQKAKANKPKHPLLLN